MRAENINEYLASVSEVRRRFNFTSDDRFGPWFRGQERADWLPSPKLYRDFGGYRGTFPKVEYETREEFIVRAPILCDAVPGGDGDRAEWEWYFMMQHYGAPTRLLDWTEGSLIALFFAVRANPGFYDAAVWMLDPYSLNKRVIGLADTLAPNAAGVIDRKRIRRWLPERYQEKVRLPEKPVAVYPAHFVRRINTQRSCFTVQGSDEGALGDESDYLAKIIIPAYSVHDIRTELERCGIDESTVFPDLDGLGRSICLNWRMADNSLPYESVFARIRPSTVAKGGVGVFAIKDIKKGTLIFPKDIPEMLWVDETRLKPLKGEVRKLYDDFAVLKHKRFGCPTNFNRLTISWYLNEPKKGNSPNVSCSEQNYEFYALRDIKADEELLIDHSTYSD